MKHRRSRPYIVEMNTLQGKVCERFATYGQAVERIEKFPAENLVSAPFLYEELVDGSFRVIREDGKPLQAHRVMDEEVVGDPLPLCEDQPLGKPIKVRDSLAEEEPLRFHPDD